jgi:hypothetical protein
MRRVLMLVSLAVFILCALSGARVLAVAETWFEIKSPNLTVLANANDGSTRTLIWQFEQVRNVAKTLWPWMQADLPKPLMIIAVKDEQSMRALLPWYWQQKAACGRAVCGSRGAIVTTSRSERICDPVTTCRSTRTPVRILLSRISR